MSEAIARRLHDGGRKRMLALDGGGTRGIITIAFLRQMEAVLQKKLGRGDDFVLADYFDLIGGTSVGSILATLLALGWRMERIEDTFVGWAPEIFRSRWVRNPDAPRFNASALSAKIRSVVDKEQLRSEQLKTGLCIVCKRADTGSVWPLINNPAARYWEGSGDVIGNGEYLLHDLIRASTAAPTYFHPVKFEVFRSPGANQKRFEGRFIDGAVSPHNSPAMLMFMMASLRGYNLGGGDVRAGTARAWKLGMDDLLLISVGTGAYPTPVKESWFNVKEATDALLGVIGDGQKLGLTWLQALGKTGFNWHLDSEMGDLALDQLGPVKLLSFQRYDMPLDKDWLLGKRPSGIAPGPHLRAALKTAGLSDADTLERKLKSLQELIAPMRMAELLTLARAAAEEQVQADHFPDVFGVEGGSRESAPAPAWT